MLMTIRIYGLAPRLRAAVVAVMLFAGATALPAQALRKAEPDQLGFSKPRLERLSEVLDQYVRDKRLAGGVVLVARHGRIAYLHAFGMRDVESKSPMQADAIFRIASQTKALVSVGIMMLMEDGRLLLNDPVGKYIPQYMKTKVAVAKEGGGYDVVDARRPITIRDLLTHTAGIHYGLSGIARDEWVRAGMVGWYFADRNEPMDSVVVRLAALPFETQPGERFVYGYGTDILGVVIERVSGMTLDEFLGKRILEPLRMIDTHFFLPAEKRNRLTTVYSAKEDGTITRAPHGGGMAHQGDYVDGPRKAFGGGAGLLSTATDYARFIEMLRNGGELDGVRVLSPATVKLMTTDHVSNYLGADRGFGLGFETIEDVGEYGQLASEGAFGWGGAYHSSYWVDPSEGLVVVYLTQLAPARTIDDFGKVRALIYSSIIESGEK
jgi:CubicO group peptidase (beta-lactamase class C family)